MSFPYIPDIDPKIEIKQKDAAALLISSIAMEELSLSHLLNSEAEKLFYLLGEIKDSRPPKRATFGEVLKINRSINKILRDVIKKQMLLQFQLEDVVDTVKEECLQ